jgi:hypothetical protein
MKRCDICDSTEIIDTMVIVGEEPLKYWVELDNGDHRCDRCEDSIQIVRDDFNYDDTILYGDD